MRMEEPTKTYFMAWEVGKRRGHSILNVKVGVKPVEVFEDMLRNVEMERPMGESGKVAVTQFNRVE